MNGGRLECVFKMHSNKYSHKKKVFKRNLGSLYTHSLSSSQLKVGMHQITWGMFSNYKTHRSSTTTWGVGVERGENFVWKKFPGHSDISSLERKLLDLVLQ